MMNDEALLQHDSVFCVGSVVAVDGRRVRIVVNKLKNSSHLLYKGEIVRNVAVGSYIKITKGFDELIAVIDGERIEEDRTSSREYRRATDPLSRTLEVSLIGYLEKGGFIRGVREMPLLGNECFILTEKEFETLHKFVGEKDIPLQIGSLAMEPTQPIRIGTNAIFASHIGIFGNTGSGKSYTLAKLYHELFSWFGDQKGFSRRAKFVLIDFNGEYINKTLNHEDKQSTEVVTEAKYKSEYVLTTRREDGDKLPLPTAAIADATFWTVLLDATEKTQAPFIARVLASDFWERKLQQSENLLEIISDMVLRATKSSDLSVDRQTVMNLLGEIQTCLGDSPSQALQNLIEDFRINLNFHSQQKKFFWGQWNNNPTYSDSAEWPGFIKGKITGLTIDFSGIQPGIDLIRFKIVLQYYSDIISGFANREHLSPLIKRMETRVPSIKKLIVVSDDGLPEKPLIVLSLRDVNLSMRKVIPMLVCKHLYDDKKESDPGNENYLNLIIDEAHNILSLDSTRESEAWRDYRLETFEEIIKEGRKFGVFLTIASQRPHDISPTIISQLHNYFLHRLVNDLDIRAVEKAVAYLDRVSFESLPILPTGVCILAGVSAQVPVMVKMAELDEKFAPNSRTMSVTEAWLGALDEPPDSEPDHA